MTLTPKQIAEKYVHGLHDALTDSQEKKDMISDIESLITTVHFNAYRTMMYDCAAKWNQDINKPGGGFPRLPEIDIVQK